MFGILVYVKRKPRPAIDCRKSCSGIIGKYCLICIYIAIKCTLVTSNYINRFRTCNYWVFNSWCYSQFFLRNLCKKWIFILLTNRSICLNISLYRPVCIISWEIDIIVVFTTIDQFCCIFLVLFRPMLPFPAKFCSFKLRKVYCCFTSLNCNQPCDIKRFAIIDFGVCNIWIHCHFQLSCCILDRYYYVWAKRNYFCISFSLDSLIIGIIIVKIPFTVFYFRNKPESILSALWQCFKDFPVRHSSPIGIFIYSLSYNWIYVILFTQLPACYFGTICRFCQIIDVFNLMVFLIQNSLELFNGLTNISSRIFSLRNNSNWLFLYVIIYKRRVCCIGFLSGIFISDL